jgi:hypothetical protein
VHYSADVAGRYSLVVRCSSTGEVKYRQCFGCKHDVLSSFSRATVSPILPPRCAQVLKGSPFAIGIAPGLADAAKSSATIEAAGRSERRLEVLAAASIPVIILLGAGVPCVAGLMNSAVVACSIESPLTMLALVHAGRPGACGGYPAA